MIGTRIAVGRRRGREEGERPFWISFADMMTALMVLFLVVMSVALLAVTKTVSEAERRKAEREKEIDLLLSKLEDESRNYPGIVVYRDRHLIDFGDRARFDSNSSQLSPSQAKYLRSFIPVVLKVANDDLGKKWLKQIVVEGFADERGDYLLNLNLSLQRSQRVLCVLLAPLGPDESGLASDEKDQVRSLFLVGGYSSNSAKKTLDESRRIELQLAFLSLGEARPPPAQFGRGEVGVCRI
jgi:flagellar motor protein MotB